jgi:uncharacterized protein YndB with AHSA1/START domain
MSNTASPEFVTSRTFDAPRALVWRVLTEPEHMAQWFGPKGFTGKTHRLDMRPGGIYHYSLTGEDGLVMWGRWIYREISPMDRLVFVQSFSDAEGGLAHSPFPGPWPMETLSTFTLSEENGKTTFTVHWTPLNAAPDESASFAEGFGHMTGGWSGTFDQLAEYLTKVKA